MKRISTILFLLLTVAFITSCATIFKGDKGSVNFTSDPGQADVYVNGQPMGKTPVQLELKVNKTYNIEFRKEGYVSQNYILNNSVGGGWVVLDILGGLIPIVVDAATGAWYDFDQEHVNMILQEQN